MDYVQCKQLATANRWRCVCRPIDTAGMATQPSEPPKATIWSIYKVAKKAMWLGTVEAPDIDSAIEKAATKYKIPASKLLAAQRGS
jgi:hypothetical protein